MSTRRKPARWRKAKDYYWGLWELWRGEAWLAKIMECKLRGGGCKYLWWLVGRDPSGQAETLAEAKRAAKIALDHAEIEEAIADVVDRWPDGKHP
jgi:hypothetical protein